MEEDHHRKTVYTMSINMHILAISKKNCVRNRTVLYKVCKMLFAATHSAHISLGIFQLSRVFGSVFIKYLLIKRSVHLQSSQCFVLHVWTLIMLLC